jgi:hypothetical protein
MATPIYASDLWRDTVNYSFLMERGVMLSCIAITGHSEM